jgi:ATP-binding cassette, subfamily B, bacterial HlyB/CyaB
LNQLQEKAVQQLDTRFLCLLLLFKYYGVHANPDHIRHSFAIEPTGMSELDMLRVAKAFGFKGKKAKISFPRLKNVNLPTIVPFTNNDHVIVARVEEDRVLLLHPAKPKPELMDKDAFLSLWNGTVYLFQHRMKEHRDEKFGLSWFLPVLWKYRKPFLDIMLASLFLQFLGIFAPILTQVIIDKVFVHNALTTLHVLAVGLLFVAFFELCLQIAKSYLFTHSTSRIDVVLGAKLFHHLVSLPLRYFETRRVGETIARIKELENIRRFLTGAPLSTVIDCIFVTVFLGVMIFYSSELTMVVAGAIPIMAILSLIVTPMLRKRLQDMFEHGAESQSYLVEAVTGIQTIKSFALEPTVEKKWETLLANYVRSNYKMAKLSGISSAIGQFIQRLSQLAVLWVGARLVLNGTLTVGQLIAFQMLSSRVSDPILRMVQIWNEYQQINVSIQRIADIFHAKPEQRLEVSKSRLPALQGNIRFEGVTFRYQLDGQPIIKNMNVQIPAGCIVGIVGRSGSGKSTISKLLQRLYVPESGKIIIDGIDLSVCDPYWLRRQIGVVMQDSFIFTGSIRENIAIHNTAASMEEITRAAILAGAHSFILELPEGYDTVVGERGVGLSGGQKQRIAIARALLTNPRILILDEATSALDYESERIIQRNLKNICQGRTVIIIAHRLSTLQDADLIIAVDKGEVKEFGPPQELLKRKGLYYYLYSQQHGGNISHV